MCDARDHIALWEVFQGDRAQEQSRLPLGEDNVVAFLISLWHVMLQNTIPTTTDALVPSPAFNN